ncbi:MAG: esterase family protein [Oscillospiraceae bacterium]|nr:esterase family protein [Oscillospiraceae bacterium]
MSEANVKKINFHSNILNKDMGINVYIPKGYNANLLPILYFLHGRSGNEDIMFDLNINVKADELIATGKIKPIIIVCPRIENSRGINSSLICKEVFSPGNSDIVINIGMYEDYFIKEVISLIENEFNTTKDRRSRYIGGVSAGGYAALHYAFRHQEMFSKVGGHMPAIELNLEEEDTPYFNDMSIWEKYDPITIAKNNYISKDIKIYLDAGNQDEGHFYDGCKILQNILEQKGTISQNHIFIGHHSLEYVASNLEKYLEFYSL